MTNDDDTHDKVPRSFKASLHAEENKSEVEKVNQVRDGLSSAIVQ